ncbi:unnamed protein product [Lymnaea stagnalis]|uniref:Uncharacterized protein n=1 Tax=Lymnaea stagnalis TaxID=6523 RepID=A0AAV2GYL6_LYMST
MQQTHGKISQHQRQGMSSRNAKSKTKSSVHHRSDMLMEKQVQHVQELQLKLQSGLQELERATLPSLIQKLRVEVADLKEESQNMILTFQVMDKINIELAYARAELNSALQQSNSSINEARKRVIWLEDKMGELCCKKIPNNNEITIVAAADQCEIDKIVIDVENQQSTSCSLERSNFKDKEDDESQSLGNQGLNDLTGDLEQKLNVKGFMTEERSLKINKAEDSQSVLEKGIKDYLKGDDEEKGESDQDDVNCRSDSTISREDLFIDSNKEEIVHVRDPIYLTEVEGQNTTVLDQLNNKTEGAKQQDLATEYWHSEHHRFHYSEFAKAFTDFDPLSYHQVGLAVPGSFIQKTDINTEYKELPWRVRRKGSDIKDVHRVALDKLASKIHGLYDKIYDAAQISVRSWNGSSNLSKETICSQGALKLESGTLVPIKTRVKYPQPLPRELSRSSINLIKQHNFYPKPIPPPLILPITRTSPNKEFPRFASSFCKPDPDSRKPAERIVDQHNLMEETRLVLYREKIKSTAQGAAHLERKFQKMIESDGATNNKSSGKKLQTSLKAAVAVARLQSGKSTWNLIKPDSRGKQYPGLRWERVKTIVHIHLQSERVEERIDGARQLGLLRCGDTMVSYALRERLQKDPEDRVRYEAAKSLILIGCWDEEVLECVLKYLILGNTEVRADLIQTIINGKNVQYISKTLPSFSELAKVLSHICQNPDPDDMNSFIAAVCMGQLCIKDEHAHKRLVQAVEDSKDTHIKAQALEIIVKQLHFTDDSVIQHIENMLVESPVWSYRALACHLLVDLGSKHEYVIKHHEKIYQLLEKRLWDDPSMDVRRAAAKSLTALGMFSRACDNVIIKLEDVNEESRAQAVVAVGTLGMKNEKLIRFLLEMLELDSSDYVRLMIIRTFRVLKLADRRIIRSLKEREKLDGALGRECGKALKVLDEFVTVQSSKLTQVN